ncbi:hypothetical protein CKM354_000373500 [Cercospora kikuchii]|uniref:Carbonic anhydrase n=1 Tax=Cercospora kikuchii TaxID=84275 RepID=A0A9P3FDZ7_9PEZI|nr:uncharacterized protein CKM354_000373500 [Cercospora kikuchii]GIZ40397.1 hypothetical protein CKM354_000373500 [Cercospora kikuchii]
MFTKHALCHIYSECENDHSRCAKHINRPRCHVSTGSPFTVVTWNSNPQQRTKWQQNADSSNSSPGTGILSSYAATEGVDFELTPAHREGLPEYKKPLAMKNFIGMPQTPENGRIFIVSCSDARIEPAEFLRLKKGEANIIRVAGGRVQEQVLRSLEIMGTIAPIGLVMVIHHSDCGGMNTTDDEIRARLSARVPDHAYEVRDKIFGTFGHIGLENCIREDVERIKAWPFLPNFAKVVGYALDDETGELRQVV